MKSKIEKARKKEKDMSFGSYKHFPYYAVIGRPTEFYLWLDRNGRGINKCSKWIKGKNAFEIYYKLKSLHKNKQEFINYFEQIFLKYYKK